MSDREQLHASILTHPGEDTPRLAFADWLNEYGGCADRARAEFIRVQVEWSRSGAETPTGPVERALLTRWGYEWLPRFASATRSDVRVGDPLAPPSVIRSVHRSTELVYFARGFPDHYLFASRTGDTVATFSKRAAALFAVAPVTHFELEVEGCEPWVEVWVAPTAEGWQAELYVRAGEPAVGPLDELLAHDRQMLANGLERWVRETLADVCFELADERSDARAGRLMRAP